MVVFYPTIPAFLLPWIPEQHLYFVGTAPLAGNGHVNLSPKCMRGTFHVESESRVWYEDLTGSGTETIAHLTEPGNGRITLMFVAFDGPPRILRLYGTGVVHELGSPEYEQYLPEGQRSPGSRAVIVVDVSLVSTSCGYSIPRFAYASERDLLHRFAHTKETNDREHYETVMASSALSSGLPSPSSPSSTAVEVEDGPDDLDLLPTADNTSTTTKEVKVGHDTDAKTVSVSSVEPAPNGLRAYWLLKNVKSIDGLPSLRQAFDLPVIPRSAVERRAATSSAEGGSTDEAYERAKAAELALPAGAISSSVSDAERFATRTGNLHSKEPKRQLKGTDGYLIQSDRDRRMLVVGFVAGLGAAVLVETLLVLLKWSRG